jgi:hypothetical protein
MIGLLLAPCKRNAHRLAYPVTLSSILLDMKVCYDCLY